MENLFTYNSFLSFGLGARHLSVWKSKTGNFYYQNGTPQNTGKKYRAYISEKEENEIRNLINRDADNADYIEYVILK